MKQLCPERTTYKTLHCKRHHCTKERQHDGKHLCHCGVTWITVPKGDKTYELPNATELDFSKKAPSNPFEKPEDPPEELGPGWKSHAD